MQYRPPIELRKKFDRLMNARSHKGGRFCARWNGLEEVLIFPKMGLNRAPRAPFAISIA